MATLFEVDSQYREKETLWRVFSFMPLFRAFSGGLVWRWFAINIPMNIVEGGFTSDIDVIARLLDFRTREWIYKSWEVKVSLLCQDGTARSLKVGKTVHTINQLKAYREFGSPEVSLFDIYLCEAGYNKPFPPASVSHAIVTKRAALAKHNFGYQLLPFGHQTDGHADTGLFLLTSNIMQRRIDVLPAIVSPPKEPFSILANQIHEFSERARPRNFYLDRIVYCRDCQRLQLINMRETYTCPECNSDLIAQS